VVQERANIGFAFDGDGDRFFTIDDRGQFVSGFLTAIMAATCSSLVPRSCMICASGRAC
jgi:phosphomannomutase